MKTMIKLLTIIVGLTVLSAWKKKQTNPIKNATWLIGTWEMKTKKGSIYESWMKVNDHELLGRSYMISGIDTNIFENMQLLYQNNKLIYMPTVKKQNNGLPIRFPAKNISVNKLIFQNTKHDFPQIITYTRTSADSLVAEISGSVNGQQRKLSFPMKRIK
jgi:hypothetical protein